MRRERVRLGSWALEALVLEDPPLYGGLVLANVRHDGYNFARDIRVVRVWASSELPTADRAPELKLALGDPAGLRPDGLSGFPFALGEPAPSHRLVAAYRPHGEIFAKYKTDRPLFSGATGKLAVTQRYLFTPYGNYLSHEPSGKLKAARLYPLFEFSYDGDSKGTRTLRYLRVDYRCEIVIDSTLRRAEAAAAQAFRQFSPNQGGIFLDREPGPSARKILSSGAGGIFEAGEKPLLWEVIGQGLVRGKKGDWDNYHQWGAQREDRLPIAPGTPHAAHTHWRWAPAFASKDPSLFVPKGGEQYYGGSGGGTPLTDSRIADQSLRFAVTVTPPDSRAPADWRADANASTHPFDALFTGVAGDHPADIRAGAQLAVWFSFEVFRNQPPHVPWAGSVFVNGFFFPHEPEPRLSTLFPSADEPPRAFKAPLRPRDPSKRWVRRPTG